MYVILTAKNKNCHKSHSLLATKSPISSLNGCNAYISITCDALCSLASVVAPFLSFFCVFSMALFDIHQNHQIIAIVITEWRNIIIWCVRNGLPSSNTNFVASWPRKHNSCADAIFVSFWYFCWFQGPLALDFDICFADLMYTGKEHNWHASRRLLAVIWTFCRQKTLFCQSNISLVSDSPPASPRAYLCKKTSWF